MITQTKTGHGKDLCGVYKCKGGCENNPKSKYFKPNQGQTLNNDEAKSFIDTVLGESKYEVLSTTQGLLGETITTFKNPLSGAISKAQDIVEADINFKEQLVPEVSILDNQDEWRKSKEHNQRVLVKRAEDILAFQKEYQYKGGESSFVFKFDKPVSLPINGYKREETTEIEGRFIKSANNYLYWQPKGRTTTAFRLPDGFLENVSGVSSVSGARKSVDNFEKAQKLRDKNLWASDNLDIAYSGRPIRSIRGLIPDEDIKKIEEAIKNKTNFRTGSSSGWRAKRRYSVSVQFDEQGNGKAFFASEYSGLGHGDYYLLINPTTAVFCEKD